MISNQCEICQQWYQPPEESSALQACICGVCWDKCHAANDLLESAEEIYGMMRQYFWTDGTDVKSDSVIGRLSAAIKKAKGES